MGSYFSSPAKDVWKSDVRYAMDAGTFCVICGGPFDIEGDVYNIDPKDPRFQVRHIAFDESPGLIRNDLTCER